MFVIAKEIFNIKQVNYGCVISENIYPFYCYPFYGKYNTKTNNSYTKLGNNPERPQTFPNPKKKPNTIKCSATINTEGTIRVALRAHCIFVRNFYMPHKNHLTPNGIKHRSMWVMMHISVEQSYVLPKWNLCFEKESLFVPKYINHNIQSILLQLIQWAYTSPGRLNEYQPPWLLWETMRLVTCEMLTKKNCDGGSVLVNSVSVNQHNT